ncbi:hypothetical protein KCP78_18795 [Salmonella enterica subsp. enterica]|nr:hypothetical protein KCP78_18795 [Salmonella enterica subsp. enterica]
MTAAGGRRWLDRAVKRSSVNSAEKALVDNLRHGRDRWRRPGRRRGMRTGRSKYAARRRANGLQRGGEKQNRRFIAVRSFQTRALATAMAFCVGRDGIRLTIRRGKCSALFR